MANINLSFGHLYGYGYEPEEIMRHVRALEAAGHRVNLLIQQPEGVKMLLKQPSVSKRNDRRVMTTLVVIGLLASVASIMFGMMGLHL